MYEIFYEDKQCNWQYRKEKWIGLKDDLRILACAGYFATTQMRLLTQSMRGTEGMRDQNTR